MGGVRGWFGGLPPNVMRMMRADQLGAPFLANSVGFLVPVFKIRVIYNRWDEDDSLDYDRFGSLPVWNFASNTI